MHIPKEKINKIFYFSFINQGSHGLTEFVSETRLRDGFFENSMVEGLGKLRFVT